MLNKDMLNSYSFIEKRSIDRWIDGQPIYQKTILFHLDANNNISRIAHGISNLDMVINYTGFYEIGRERRFIPQFYMGSDDKFKLIPYIVNDTEIHFYYGDFLKNYAGADFYITLYYTKTTD